MKKDFIHTSESVTEGHPDKLCDQISDAIIDRFLERDVCARIIAECAVSLSLVFIAARFASEVKVDFPNVARKVIRKIGYIDHEFNFKTCSILTSLKEMTPEHPCLVDEKEASEKDIDGIVAYDQVTLFGFACNQSPTLLPLPIWLAHKISRRLSEVRLQGVLPIWRLTAPLRSEWNTVIECLAESTASRSIQARTIGLTQTGAPPRGRDGGGRTGGI